MKWSNSCFDETQSTSAVKYASLSIFKIIIMQWLSTAFRSNRAVLEVVYSVPKSSKLFVSTWLLWFLEAFWMHKLCFVWGKKGKPRLPGWKLLVRRSLSERLTSLGPFFCCLRKQEMNFSFCSWFLKWLAFSDHFKVLECCRNDLRAFSTLQN